MNTPKNEDEILAEIDGTELCGQIRRLREVYALLAEKQKAFCDCFDVHCGKGCGSCCEHFVPDVTRTEAEILAVGLIAEGLDEAVLARIGQSGEGPERCLFFDPDSEFHCTVYKWRPLICRLFGASLYENKEGKTVYRRCKWNRTAPETLTEEQLSAHRELLVTMSEFGLLTDECDPEDTERELLPAALRRAIDKVRLFMELEEEKDP